MSLLNFKHSPLQMKIFTVVSTFAVLQVTLQDLGFHNFNLYFNKPSKITTLLKYLIVYSVAVTSTDDITLAILSLFIYVLLDLQRTNQYNRDYENAEYI